MGGGLLQIVAYGAQDVYLTEIHKLHFLKQFIEDILNFSIESTNKPLTVQQILDKKFQQLSKGMC